MSNIPTFTEQAKYIIKNVSCPITHDGSSIFIYCRDCICFHINNNCSAFDYNRDFCKKYLYDLRENKLKRILKD